MSLAFILLGIVRCAGHCYGRTSGGVRKPTRPEHIANKERPARETCNLSSFLAVDPTVRSVIGRVRTADVHTPTDVKLKCKTVKYNRRC